MHRNRPKYEYVNNVIIYGSFSITLKKTVGEGKLGKRVKQSTDLLSKRNETIVVRACSFYANIIVHGENK